MEEDSYSHACQNYPSARGRTEMGVGNNDDLIESKNPNLTNRSTPDSQILGMPLVQSSALCGAFPSQPSNNA